MSRVPARSLFALLVWIGFASVLLTGCYGHHHHHRPPSNGAIEVANAATSIEVIEVVRVERVHGHVVDTLNVIVPPGQSVIVGALPPSAYDVTVIWSDGRRDVVSPVDVFSGQTAMLEVVN